MLGWRVTGEQLAEERRVRTKMSLAGDDRHLASIERGGPFTDLSRRRGAAEISEITRPRADRQRITARDVAEGRFTDAVPRKHQAPSPRFKEGKYASARQAEPRDSPKAGRSDEAPNRKRQPRSRVVRPHPNLAACRTE